MASIRAERESVVLQRSIADGRPKKLTDPEQIFTEEIWT
jgi:hypothetical protein